MGAQVPSFAATVESQFRRLQMGQRAQIVEDRPKLLRLGYGTDDKES